MADNSRRSGWLVVPAALVVLLALGLWFLLDSEDDPGASVTVTESASPAPKSEAGSVRRTASRRSETPHAPAAEGADAGATAQAPALTIVAGWGSGLHELGRSRPEEGNPEAPMSLSFDRAGRPLVLDQVNGRIVRYDEEGNPVDTVPTTQQAPQDLVVAADGTTAVLDRLVDKSVALLDENGRLRGELPVEGKGIEEGGGVTGVFVDGEDVYVEREHGDLVRVGDTSGNVDTERPEIPGRPSRDGKSYLNAGLIEPEAGRLYVNSIERPSGQHRFTRELRMGAPTPLIVLLDTDLRGNIYLGALLATPEDRPSLSVRVVCLSPADGQPWGSADLPANEGAEETFRDLVVLDEGGMIYAYRTEAGVTYQRYACR